MGEIEFLSNTVAAQALGELLPTEGKTHEQWLLWLQNNRNQARRVAYRIPHERGIEGIGGGIFYRREELAKYADWEKSRQLGTLKLTGQAAEAMRAFGIGTASGSTTGRKLKVSGIKPQIDEATGTAFVQLITDDPLMVYRLELEQAEAILHGLGEAIGACRRGA